MGASKQLAIWCVVLCGGAVARADNAPPPPQAVPTASPGDDGNTEVITITDKTEAQKLFEARAPVTVITRKDLEVSGHATLGDILQALPSQANAGNAQVNEGGDGATRINLRGLGAARTLVLINGRRMVPGGPGADSSVDLNAIPLAMIERVEVYKDGASTLYGADAVGGVVNLITRPQYDGVDVTLLTSTTQHGDGSEIDGSFVTGFTTDDKDTYLVVSGGYQHHEPVFAGDRHFSAVQRSFDFATGKETHTLSLTGPSGRLDTTSLGPGGLQPQGCTSTVCKPDGHGGFTNFGTGDLYNDAANDYVYTPSTRYNVFATGGNRLNDHMTLFVEALYQHRDSSRQLSPVPFDANAVISKDSIYNPLGGDIGDYRLRLTQAGDRQFIDNVSTIRFVGGVTGTLPFDSGPFKQWNYELSYTFGQTKEEIGTTGQLLTNRLADALGPSMIVNGTPICVSRPGDPSSQIIYKIGLVPTIPCVPLNLLAGNGKIPAAQLKNLTFKDAGSGSDEQGTFLATTNGRLATLPHHGEVTMVAGVDYRSEDGLSSPPSVASSGDSTDNQAKKTEGDYHTYEGYAELTVVPIADDPIAHRLEFDLGARVLDHSKFGSELTYKAGGLFRTVQGLAARATYATAFRVPTFLDLLEGQTERMPFVEDPCDTAPPSAGGGTRALSATAQAQCTAQNVPAGSRFNTSQQTSLIGGNAALKPETAATATAGIVYEPPQLPGVAVSADYWHIRIDHAIETLGVATILANCYGRGEQAFCKLVQRDFNSHRITAIDQSPQNVDHTATSGLDVALAYDARLEGFGRVHAALDGQYLVGYDLATGNQTIHGAGVYDLGAFPRLRANLATQWSHPGGAAGGFTLRYVGSFRECASDDCGAAHALSRDVGQYAKLDLFGGYDFRSRLGKTSVQIGVNNVFNITPPLVYNAPSANSDATTYDFVGRMAYLRMSQQF
ncbi:MAG TPA: TonB-dependent receptor [Kofleriaceae bacterium]|nr:TonB-dependent receptor [Kofleriaceae bacterium]